MKELLSPMTGTAVPLEQIPDDVFSRKLLGDGAAILPDEGRILSPVDGVVSAVAETLHAYCFSTPEGLEILIHVGLESVRLRGEGFVSHVKAGDMVRAGDPVATVDLQLLRRRNLPLITAVVICEGAEGTYLSAATGPVTAGKTTLLSI